MHHSGDGCAGVAAALGAASGLAFALVAIRFISKGESALAIAQFYHTASILLGIIPLLVGSILALIYL